MELIFSLFLLVTIIAGVVLLYGLLVMAKQADEDAARAFRNYRRRQGGQR